MTTQEEYGKVIAKNLKRLLYEKDKTQTEMARELGIAKTTVNSWMRGERTPKYQTIDLLCEYFGCKRNDILEPFDYEHTISVPEEGAYYLSPSEVLLIDYYRHLNAPGKERALTALDDLVHIDKYTE